MATPTPQPGILDIDLYVGGQSTLAGHKDVLKLSSNESPYGPPPAAQQALRDCAAQMHRYPSTDHAALRAAIGQVYRLDPDRIICGVGSDEVLGWLAGAYAGVGDEVIYTAHGFGMYKIFARAVGARPVKVTEDNRCVDADAILDAINSKTRLIYIANPGNPTGTMIGGDALRRLAAGLPPQVVLVLDGAYAEFATGYDGGVSVVDAHGNVVMTRTFSKLYGLGGLRVGWGYAPRPIIDVLSRIRGPFNLSAPALAAAEAAVRDTAFAQHMTRENARLRDWMRAELAGLGIETDPSFANFVLARFASPYAAQACDTFLKSQGIIVRGVAGYGFPEALRITVGDAAGCQRVINAIAAFKDTQT